jgi:hypothetical protein
MNVVEAALRRIANDLDKSNQTWALVGGFAVAARAEPRFTRDVHVALAVADDAEAESVVQTLVRDGYVAFTAVENYATNWLATVRLGSPLGGRTEIAVDLLFASSGIEKELVAAAELTEVVPGLILPLATTGHLIALKLLARDDQTRPQDLADLRALRGAATEADLRTARDAVHLILRRGFGRGRELDRLLDEFSSTSFGWTPD